MSMTLHREVYRLLKNTTNYLKDELRIKIEEYGITWQQFHALFHIEDDGTKFNELARELSCNASNMTGLIDRMIENHWVYREQSETDRRVWFVKLTEEGKKLKTTLLPKHHENIKEYMSVLSEDELNILKILLNKLIAQENEGE